VNQRIIEASPGDASDAPKEFTDSTPLLGDDAALAARFGEDGYLYLRGVVDREPLVELRREITSICARHGWLRPDRDPMEAVPRVEPRVESEDPFFEVYDDVQRLQAFHAMSHEPSVRRIMEPLLGRDLFPHPLGIARLSFPYSEAWATPPHQDFYNNQGTEELFACWMPLSDCPIALGPLSILRGSHRLGLLPLAPSLGAGFRRAVLTPDHDRLDWVSGDMALGDVLVFHSLTVHRALPNRSDRLRLSVDYRFQREGAPLTEGCLKPHFDRLSWDEIYADWERDDLKYYWRRSKYEVVPFDRAPFEVSDEELVEQVREFVTWRWSHPPVE
jgi:ectoine hydroxylase-related dioxygenase (phytanoyl-CoA dioxygenase family)